MAHFDDIVGGACRFLRQGSTLLYPTDTIWGLGCDATNGAAVDSLYALKRRDPSKSMLVLCADLTMAETLTGSLPDEVKALLMNEMRPTTVILPVVETDSLADNLLASDGTIGIRIPRMEFCQSLLRAFGGPIVSTSANFSGRPAPVSFDEIEEELKRRVGFVVPPAMESPNAATRGSRIVKLLDNGQLLIIRD